MVIFGSSGVGSLHVMLYRVKLWKDEGEIVCARVVIHEIDLRVVEATEEVRRRTGRKGYSHYEQHEN